MKLITATLNGQTVLLNPEESRFAVDLEAKVALGDREAAATEWRAWVAEGYGVPARNRRSEVGRALGLTIDRRLHEDQLVAAVRENMRVLSGCIVHRFNTREITDWSTAPERLECIHCGGHMTVPLAHSYATGWAAHGGDPELVIEGFGR